MISLNFIKIIREVSHYFALCPGHIHCVCSVCSHPCYIHPSFFFFLLFLSTICLYPFNQISERRLRTLRNTFLVYFLNFLTKISELMVFKSVISVFNLKKFVLLERRIFQILELLIQVLSLFLINFLHFSLDVIMNNLILM